MSIRMPFREWRYRRCTREYRAADHTTATTLTALGTTADAAERCRLLHTLADQHGRMSNRHRDVFGPDPIRDEDDRDMAESLRHTATLYRALAYVEEAVADGGPRSPVREGRAVEMVAGQVLDAMACHRDLHRRAALLGTLYEAVVPVVGLTAAGVLLDLPSPGMVGPVPVDTGRRSASGDPERAR